MKLSEYHDLYRVRKYFVVNNGDGDALDPDLKPIVFSLPDPPQDWTNIKNYGLHPDDQVYRIDELPKKIALLEEDISSSLREKFESNKNRTISGYKITKEFWSKLSDQADKYVEEIQWIRHVLWKRYYGEWVFIDGQLMWLPPRYYMYINFWWMSVKNGYDRPEFRIRDWKSACVNHYLRHTHESFHKLSKKGIAQKNENGEYDVRNMGVRVFYGPIRPKNRRSGATHEALNEGHEIVATGIGKKATALSKSVTDVIEFFDEMVFPSWRRMPIFLKPSWLGSSPDGQKLEYKAQSNMLGADSMDSVFYYVKTTDEIVVDSKRLDFILLDEQGKKTGGGRVDVAERWAVSKQTLATGNGANIHGFAMNPSTAEEMEDGAKQYKVMCDQSNFYQRSAIGQTKSGLMLVYFPAQYCLEGFVDCFGKPVLNAPTERQIRLMKKHFPDKDAAFIHLGMGSKDYLLSERNQFLISGTQEDLSMYRAQMRKHPMRYSESWIGEAGDMGFPIVNMDKRLAEEDIADRPWVDYGHFAWVGKFGTNVKWVPGDDTDKFELSYHIKQDFSNRKKNTKVFNGLAQKWEWQWGPLDPRFILGCDTFGFDNKQLAQQREDKSRKSDGGIGGYYPFDPQIDDGVDADKRVSDLMILSYRHKPPSTDAFNEDLLMAAIYLGAWVYPERNISNTWEYFIRSGFGGYLKYDINLSTGKLQDKPGYYMGGEGKKHMFQLVASYLDRNIHREKHMAFVRECKEMKGPEDLLNKDRLAAHGAALMGARDMLATSTATDNTNRVSEAYKAMGYKF